LNSTEFVTEKDRRIDADANGEHQNSSGSEAGTRPHGANGEARVGGQRYGEACAGGERFETHYVTPDLVGHGISVLPGGEIGE
jgi:hypothetical protein